MARPTFNDLILFRTPTAGVEGLSQSAINNIITLLFKDLFRIFAKGQYNTYSTSVDHPTLDTTDIYSIIIRRATVIANEWAAQIWNNRESQVSFMQVPEIRLTQEDIADIASTLNLYIQKEFIDRNDIYNTYGVI